MTGWFGAWLWTCAIELPIWARATRGLWTRPLQIVAFTLAVNLVSHPLAWRLAPGGGWPRWWAVEGCLVVAEGLALWAWWRGSPARALGVSLLANAASAAVGLAFFFVLARVLG